MHKLKIITLHGGKDAICIGGYSHTEGLGTTAVGDRSHSEGQSTIAIGTCSHSEGVSTKSHGINSHAEGASTTSIGTYSHSEGSYTTSVGNASHAEGSYTTSVGNASHAEGTHTTSVGNASHAEGTQTTSVGLSSHAEGDRTKSVGDYSHAEGTQTTSVGDYSHAEGSYTTSVGNASHAEGYYTISSGSYSHVQGAYNKINTNPYSFIIGNGTSNNNRNNLLYASGSIIDISGSVNITNNLNVLGSIVYYSTIVSSSQLIVQDNTISTTALYPHFRYAGLKAVVSGSSNSASLFWDSKDNYWLLIDSSSQSSKIIGTKPSPFGSENSLTSGYLPKAFNGNSLDNSVIYQSGTNIGIGTSSPVSPLHIHSDGNLFIRIRSAVSDGFTGFHFAGADNGLKGHFGYGNPSVFNDLKNVLYFGSIAAIPFVISTTDIERMRISSTGEVGIGTKNPLAKLHVSSSTQLVAIVQNLPVYSDNASAIAGGLTTSGSLYRTATGVVMVTF